MKNLLTISTILLATCSNLLTTSVDASSRNGRSLSATYYADYFHGRRMANGQIFSQHSNSVASNHFKLNTPVSICYRGKCVRGVVRDRCGNCGIDLSKSLFRQLAPLRKGRIRVKVFR